MDMQSAVRRLRNYINDKPKGQSVSATGPSTDLSASATCAMNVAMGEESPIAISFTGTGLNTGIKIAAAIQVALRVNADMRFKYAKCVFGSGVYTITAGDIGTYSLITITPSVSNDCTVALKLGVSSGGAETLSPPTRYEDTDAQTWISYALAAYNAKTNNQAFELVNLNEPDATLVIYMSWKMALEADAGSAAYSYRQTLGGDSIDLTGLFTNILEMLRYLDGQIVQLKEASGLSDVVVTELTRYDRLLNARVSLMAPSDTPRPRILSLVRVSGTDAIIEWQTVTAEDYDSTHVYYSASAGIFQPSVLNNSDRIEPVSAAAIKLKTVYHPAHTTLKAVGLPTGVTHMVVLFRDTRGGYRCSDEWSIDLGNVSAVAVKTINNAPKG